MPDVKVDGKTDFKSIDVDPLETLSRSVTIRLLYTNAVTGKNWQTKVKRRRVKIWTQDAQVMESWKEASILIPDKPFKEQDRLFAWIKEIMGKPSPNGRPFVNLHPLFCILQDFTSAEFQKGF